MLNCNNKILKIKKVNQNINKKIDAIFQKLFSKYLQD